jgi:hypothetical protein
LLVSNGKILLEQSSSRWCGMWILPRLELDCLKPSSSQGRPVYELVFPFTHHRITLAVYRRAAPKRIAAGQQWFGSIDHIAMPSPHRRAAQAVLSAKQVARPRPRQSSER